MPSHQRAVPAAIAAGVLGLAFLASSPGFAVNRTSLPAIGAALSPADLQDDVNGAKHKLALAADQVEKAEKAAESAAAQLPKANKDLSDAEAAEQLALRAQDAASAEAQAARTAVAAQKVKVAQAQSRMDELKARIAAMARQNYIAGQENVELGLLLESESTAEFAEQLQAVQRISRGNAELFQEVTQLQAELGARLAELKSLEQLAATKEAEANDRAADAAASRHLAAAARESIQALIAQRQQKLDEALALRKQLKSEYEALQEQLMAQAGLSAATGTSRSAKEAVAWAMQWVGSGANYDGLCLGFVDDAYGVGSGRVGTAIGQWYRAKAAGKGHPGDRNPPVGAQVFWMTGNPARHIAIYAGGGMVISTGAVGGTRVGLVPMENLDAWGPYIGWAEPYYGG